MFRQPLSYCLVLPFWGRLNVKNAAYLYMKYICFVSLLLVCLLLANVSVNRHLFFFCRSLVVAQVVRLPAYLAVVVEFVAVSMNVLFVAFNASKSHKYDKKPKKQPLVVFFLLYL